MKIHVGCSGWYYREWKDGFYQGIKQKDWFFHYTKYFQTVEINSSFYHFPKKETAQTWYQRAPDKFIYSIKAPRLITHIKRFKTVAEEMKRFYEACDELKKKLGCVLFQMPPNYIYKEENLERIINSCNRNYKNIIEFRHVSWWDEQVIRQLKKHHLGFCNVSTADFPQELIKTSDHCYLRFHGITGHDYNYTGKQLKAYAKTIATLNPKHLWIYFNNDGNGNSVNNAKYLINILT